MTTVPQMRTDEGTVLVQTRAEYWLVFVPLVALVLGAPIVFAVAGIAWWVQHPGDSMDWRSLVDVVNRQPVALWFAAAFGLRRMWKRRRQVEDPYGAHVGSAAQEGGA